MNNLEVCNLYPFFRSIIESDFQNESFTVCKSTPLLGGFHTEIFLRGFGTVGQSFTFLETNISFLYSTDKISHIIKSFFIMFVSHVVSRKNILPVSYDYDSILFRWAYLVFYLYLQKPEFCFSYYDWSKL